MSKPTEQHDKPAPSQQDDAPLAETRFDAESADAIEATWKADEAQGLRARKVIVPKDLVPGRDQAWIIQNVATQPKGSYVPLGYMSGYIFAVERRFTEWQGKRLESVWMQGMFEAESSITGEVLSAGFAILPSSFGEMIAGAFALAEKQGAHNLQAKLDVEIGLEATGRSIPYEWVVYSYEETPAQKAVKAIKAQRQARVARREQKALAGSARPLKAIGKD
jgi:hypothetical protein